MTLIDQLFASCSVPDPAAALTLPPLAYNSDEMFELERDKVFRNGWMAVCRADQVAEPGAYWCVDLLGEALVVTRARDNEIHVLSRTCRHRWMEVAQGHGTAPALQCPYHLWTYGLDGRLAGAPEMQGVVDFKTDDYCLPHVRHEIWKGFVLVNLDGNADPLGPQVAAMDALLANYDVDDYVTVEHTEWGRSPWDWKIMIDNFMECYHHIGPHRESIEDEFPARLSYTDESSGGAFSVLHSRQAEGYDITAPWLKPGSARLRPEQLRESLIFTIFPCLGIVIGPAYGYWLKVLPVGPGEIELELDVMMAPTALGGDDFETRRKNLVDGIVHIHREDIDACTKVQKAVVSGTAQPGRLSLLEQPLWEMQRFLGHKLGLIAPEVPVSVTRS